MQDATTEIGSSQGQVFVRGEATLQHAMPLVALLFASIALGFSAIFVKWAGVPGAASGFWRMLIATSLVAWPACHGIRRAWPLPRRHLGLAALAGLLFTGDLTAWNSGVLVGSAANATLLANTSPVWVAIGAVIVFRARLRLTFWGGLVLAMAGVSVIVVRDLGHHTSLAAGDLLGLLAGFFYGTFFLPSQSARRRLGALVAWWVAAASSTVGLLIVSLVMRQPLWGYPLSSWACLAAVALVTQIGGYVSINYALGHLPATLVSPILLLQPVFTALLAWPLLGEPLVATQVGGGVLVLAGIVVVHRAHAEPDPGPSA